MIRHTLICIGILSCSSLGLVARGQENPTHACPHFSYGSEGENHFWYSEFVHKDSEGCLHVEWGEYVGPEVLPTGGSCEQLGQCVGLAILPGKKTAVRASKKTAAKGLKELPAPDFEPNFGPAVTVLNSMIVDVMITPSKIIKVKLHLKLVDPRKLGHPLPPAITPSGFEVQYDPNFAPYFVVPNSSVQKITANRYAVKVGQVTYRITTEGEG